MIVAALDYLAGQAVSPAGLKKGFEWLREHGGNDSLPERVEIDGKAVYALVQTYETTPAGAEVKLEAHKNYIDIQYIVSGEEMMGWTDVRALRELTAYNPDKDVFHGMLPAMEITPVQVRPGQAAVFYPEDAHAPKLAITGSCAVRKIVVKVRVD